MTHVREAHDLSWQMEVLRSWAVAWLTFDATSVQSEKGTHACRTWDPPQHIDEELAHGHLSYSRRTHPAISGHHMAHLRAS